MHFNFSKIAFEICRIHTHDNAVIAKFFISFTRIRLKFAECKILHMRDRDLPH